MTTKSIPDYLGGYPAELSERVQRLIESQRLAGGLLKKYPTAHGIRTDKALYDYVQSLKERFLHNAGPLGKVAYDGKLQELRNALGTHTRISRVQGGKLKAKREIHVASVFRDMPPAFLEMIVVHELAHLKEPAHDKAFYQLCQHMAPDYHQQEFDLRCYLAYLASGGPALWTAAGPAGEA